MNNKRKSIIAAASLIAAGSMVGGGIIATHTTDNAAGTHAVHENSEPATVDRTEEAPALGLTSSDVKYAVTAAENNTAEDSDPFYELISGMRDVLNEAEQNRAKQNSSGDNTTSPTSSNNSTDSSNNSGDNNTGDSNSQDNNSDSSNTDDDRSGSTRTSESDGNNSSDGDSNNNNSDDSQSDEESSNDNGTRDLSEAGTSNSDRSVKELNLSKEDASEKLKNLRDVKKDMKKKVNTQGKADYLKDGQGCTTETAVLIRDTDNPGISADGCEVNSGTVRDPYTGKDIPVEQAAVDHIVSVEDALRSGAAEWDKKKFDDFYNAPENLIAVSKTEMDKRSGKSIPLWKPSNKDFVEDYAKRQILVKDMFDLGVSKAERSILAKAIGSENSQNTPRAERNNTPRGHAAPKHKKPVVKKEQKVVDKHSPNVGIVNNATSDHKEITIGIIRKADGFVEFRTPGKRYTPAGKNESRNYVDENGSRITQSHSDKK